MSDKFKGINYKFTQDYPGWENNFINALYNSVANDQPKHPPLSEAQRIETENEIAWLDYIESEFMADMTEYPDAERLLSNILK
jgi:hypothetical protein